MDLHKDLIESKKSQGRRGGWKATTASIALHAMLVGSIVYAGTQVTHKVDAEEKPIAAFITQGAAPPPPPPPPPPPAASSSPMKAQPVRPVVKPIQQAPVFSQPREIPKEVPKARPVLDPKSEPVLDLTDNEPEELPTGGADLGAVAGAAPGGVPGGVAGGQVGGVVGGEVGGVVGGELGGVKGGVIGGKLGGEVGGTGTGLAGEGTGGIEAPVVKAPEPEPPPPPPSGPMRVGGDVKAPVASHRVDPDYTETARAAKIHGVVVIEAIIDANGNVDNARVVKGLPMGLSEAAVRAVKQWKFKPGTLGGKPVATIFNLTVNFKLN